MTEIKYGSGGVVQYARLHPDTHEGLRDLKDATGLSMTRIIDAILSHTLTTNPTNHDVAVVRRALTARRRDRS